MNRGVRVRLTRRAQTQYQGIVGHSYREFGEQAGDRYASLIKAAIDCLTAQDLPRGVAEHDDILTGLRTVHLRQFKSPVKRPRHLLAYRRQSNTCIELLAILHDQMDLDSHLRELE